MRRADEVVADIRCEAIPKRSGMRWIQITGNLETPPNEALNQETSRGALAGQMDSDILAGVANLAVARLAWIWYDAH
jgi:hypothetical protein